MRPLSQALLLLGVMALRPVNSGELLGQKPKAVHSTPDSTPIVFNKITRPVFGAKDYYTSFTLKTSWIPGEDHKGSFRYQMAAYGINLNENETEAYTEKLFKCNFTLELRDKDQFILRRIDIPFVRAVSGNGTLTELEANDVKQMDLAEYRSLTIGSYDVSWSW